MNERREFSTLDIVKLLGIPRERLRVWIDKGYITPSIQTADKQGEKHLFSVVDLYIIEIFKYLIEKGYSRDKACVLIDSLQKVLKITGNKININGVKRIFFISTGTGEVECNLASFSGGIADENLLEVLDNDEWTDFTSINFEPIKTKVDSAIK